MDLFQIEDIILDHPADNAALVLEAVSLHLAARSGADMETIRAALTTREDVGSTAVDHGVAIPHARLGCVSAPAAMLMRLARPIDFDAHDGQKVDLVFAMIWPALPKENALIGLAELCRLLREPPLLHWLREAGNPREARMLLCCAAEIVASRDVISNMSRDTGRWIIPKGWPMRGKVGWEVAAREAFEEAGIEGETEALAIGAYHYAKRRPGGRSLTCRVEVFPFGVVSELKRWPERHQRRRQWFAAEEAASLVDEDELKSLILSVE